MQSVDYASLDERFQKVYQKFLRDSLVEQVPLEDRINASEEDYMAVVRAFFATKDINILQCTLPSGFIVGVVFIMPAQKNDGTAIPNIFNIIGAYVLPLYRGMRITKKLVHTAMEYGLRAAGQPLGFMTEIHPKAHRTERILMETLNDFGVAEVTRTEKENGNVFLWRISPRLIKN